MQGFKDWFTGNTLGARAVRTFLWSFIGFVATVWYAGSGPDERTITGLGEALGDQWNYAAGAALVATISNLGFGAIFQRGSTDT